MNETSEINFTPLFFPTALNKKECLRRKRSSKRGSIRVLGGSGPATGDVGVGPGGGHGGQGGQISMPTKLTQLRYSGYSAEFLDRVEPNGNIPGKNGTAIAGEFQSISNQVVCHF